MKVRSSLATISYNSIDFLNLVLDRLTDQGVIAFWFYIRHKGETGEEKKDHIHLFILPGQSIDPFALRNEFNEFVSSDQKPLRVIPFRKSKFDDAILYFLHDERYLTARGQVREFHYSYSDLVTSDPDYLKEAYLNIDWTKIEKKNPAAVIKDAVLKGMTFDELVCSGCVPAQQVAGWERMYHSIAYTLRKDWYISNVGQSEERRG